MTGAKHNDKTLFVSRSINRADTNWLQIEHRGWTIIGRSLLKLKKIPFEINLADPDWIFFGSKYGVSCFFDGLDHHQIAILRGKRFGAIGPSTAVALKEHIEQIDFVGQSSFEDMVSAFSTMVDGQSVLFPGAQQSARRLQRRLANIARIHDLVVYTNEINAEADVPDAQIVVLTSPLNARAYLQKRDASSAIVWANGPMCAEYLLAAGNDHIVLSSKPTEAVLAREILYYIKDSFA